ncbi:TPA: RHS domain-containing protein [Serratia fonticola]|uniref:RHS domain-containing protein n=1 Tax=Serratia fonticola TaxID=47917 RepID=UPI0019646AD6|nr:RHS domain-containing protein [Serratia fonticola]
MGNFVPLAQLLGKGRKSEIYYCQNDHLGTPQSLTDSHGNTVWRGQYSAYGQLTDEWTPPDARDEHPQPKLNNPLHFRGSTKIRKAGCITT